jgi:sugar (pentulose or hexulose) kinase
VTFPGPIVIGVDLGTSGVRALAATSEGQVLARAATDYQVSGRPGSTSSGASPAGGLPGTPVVHEQDADGWWRATAAALLQISGLLSGLGVRPANLQALAIDGTSGTVVPLAADGSPIAPAIMYGDRRARDEAAELSSALRDHCQRHGYRFDASFGMPKMLWLARHEPGIFERTVQLAHQADVIIGRLTGRFDVTDESTALKSGYDLFARRWPADFARWPGLVDRLPTVEEPGAPLGGLTAQAAAETGLPQGLTVVAGVTDGTAAALASGIHEPGEHNTTLGTTLVFKTLSARPATDSTGRLYSHRLPGDRWLPGAASNTGGAWIDAWFPGVDRQALDQDALSRLPGAIAAYPLVGRGERFPFVKENAVGFFSSEPADETERYAACLAGVGLVERLAYDCLDRACGTTGGMVYATGGAIRSDAWMQVRADVTGRTYLRPEVGESAFGSAILAAAWTVFGDLQEATAAMVRIERRFEPSAAHRARYDELFSVFRSELAARGYMRGEA